MLDDDSVEDHAPGPISEASLPDVVTLKPPQAVTLV